MDALQQKRHIVGHGADGLQPFGIELSLTLCASVDDVPLLRGDDGHILHLEGHEQRLIYR